MNSVRSKQKNIMFVFVFSIVVIGGYYLYKYNQRNSSIPSQLSPITPATIDDSSAVYKSGYRSFVIQTSKPGVEIAREVGLEYVPFVLAFNRLDVRHIQKSATITIPNDLTDWNALSPFPAKVTVGADITKLLVISQRVQAFAAYESGVLVRWGPVSTGKKDTQTPSKLYSTNWKGEFVISSLEGAYELPWAFNLDSIEGISMHQFDLPGYPASHACIRLLGEDAKWLYTWADQWILDALGNTELAKGTPVLIFGEYAYDKIAPWKKLAKDSSASTISQQELIDSITPELVTIYKNAKLRTQVESNTKF